MRNIKDIKLKKGMSKDDVNNLVGKWVFLEDETYIGIQHKHNWRCLCGELIKNRCWDVIRRRNVVLCDRCKHPHLFMDKNELNKVYKLKCGANAEIIGIKNKNDIIVKILETNEEIKTNYNIIKNGNLKIDAYPSVFGVGITGDEKTKDSKGRYIDSYRTWQNMLQRCYDDEFKIKHSTYKHCEVCEEWLYYSNFKKWYEENYYIVDNERMSLDKDILVKGNKIYSPDTCVFVPQKINSLFTKRDNDRGDFPLGVSFCKCTQRYRSVCNYLGQKHHLGRYNNIEDAFNSYKEFKEMSIKEVAKLYKGKIPKKLYNAMITYEVEITD